MAGGIQKVFAYITYSDRLLVFRHADFPEAGIQVPAGTLRPGEDPVEGVLREAGEETGLEALVLDELLGVDDFDMTPYGTAEIHHRYFYHLRLEQEPPQTFQHIEADPSSGTDEEIKMEFFWVRLPDEVPWLMAGHGRFLPELCRLLSLPVGELEYQAQFAVSWSEADTQDFLVRGRYFVPDRERQIEIFTLLMGTPAEPVLVYDLGCGEGLLAEAILRRFPQSEVWCFDGSWSMLRAARLRLEPFEERAQLRHFELTANDWRSADAQPQFMVSSLAIHHLDGLQKQQLFKDVFQLLAPGGSLILADIFQPAGPRGVDLAALSWDQEVLRRALELDGNDHFYQEFRRSQWNIFRYPDPKMDHPSGIFEQLRWLSAAGFDEVDVYWLQAGHAIYGGRKLKN